MGKFGFTMTCRRSQIPLLLVVHGGAELWLQEVGIGIPTQAKVQGQPRR